MPAWALEYGCAILCVALHPLYAKGESKYHQVCIGGEDGRLILATHGRRSYSPNAVIHAGEGPITAVRWQGQLIAWCNDMGVKIYDSTTAERVSFIPCPKLPTPSFDDEGGGDPMPIRPSLCWYDKRLLIGWGSVVKIARIQTRKSPKCEVICEIQFSHHSAIVGVCPFHMEGMNPGRPLAFISIMTIDTSQTGDTPKHHLATSSGYIVLTDALPIHTKGSWDYRLEYPQHVGNRTVAGSSFVVCPKDVIHVRRRDITDHTTWLLERGEYSNALDVARLAGSVELLEEVGQRCMLELFESQKFEEAAGLVKHLNMKDDDNWRSCVDAFEAYSSLALIGRALPSLRSRGAPSPQLYVDVLMKLIIANDAETVLHLLQTWDTFDLDTDMIVLKIKAATEWAMDGAVVGDARLHETWMRALGVLRVTRKEYCQALSVYLEMKSAVAFEVITTHIQNDKELRHMACKQALRLYDIDPRETVALFTAENHFFAPGEVVPYMGTDNHLLHEYLKTVFYKDPALTREYHRIQVSLFVKFDPQSLLYFLMQAHGNYCTSSALGEVRAAIGGRKRGGPEGSDLSDELRGLYESLSFLLAHEGLNLEALHVLLGDLKDVPKAVHFVGSERHQEGELWDALMRHVSTHPDMLPDVLACIDGSTSFKVDEDRPGQVDFKVPLVSIRQILQRVQKDGLSRVPNLTEKLQRILKTLQVIKSLCQSDFETLTHDVDTLKQYTIRKSRAASVVHCASEGVYDTAGTRGGRGDAVCGRDVLLIDHMRRRLGNTADASVIKSRRPSQTEIKMQFPAAVPIPTESCTICDGPLLKPPLENVAMGRCLRGMLGTSSDRGGSSSDRAGSSSDQPPETNIDHMRGKEKRGFMQWRCGHAAHTLCVTVAVCSGWRIDEPVKWPDLAGGGREAGKDEGVVEDDAHTTSSSAHHDSVSQCQISCWRCQAIDGTGWGIYKGGLKVQHMLVSQTDIDHGSIFTVRRGRT
eukprot:GHVO01023793.1.p1 GENE.GHVO01023793.1~~GHVO01023793.1.p1  ORF type:complete len:982 (+),score=170.85 GHVO01023793.1:427-3372(+)